MADTLKRLANGTRLSKSAAGSTLYTPGSGVTAIVKNARVMNTMSWDSWFTLSIGSSGVEENRVVGNLYVPALSSINVPLDVIVTNAAGDTITARQSPAATDVYSTATKLTAPSTIGGPSSGTVGSASSVTTGSYSMSAGTGYLMVVSWEKATGIGTISSFTDTHSGLTWTLCGAPYYTDASGTMRMAFYTGTGSGSATTTVTFSATQDGSNVHVIALGTAVELGEAQAAGAVNVVGFGSDNRNTGAPTITWGGVPRGGYRVYALANSAASNSATPPTNWNEIYDTDTQCMLETAQAIHTANVPQALLQPNTLTNAVAHNAGLVEIFEHGVSPLVCSLYGVEVS